MTSDLKKKALASLEGKWGLGAGVTFLYYILTAAGIYLVLGAVMLLMIPLMGSDMEEIWSGLLHLIYMVVSLFITGIMMLGLLNVYLKLARGENAGAEDLFRYFRGKSQMWLAFKSVFLVGLYTLLWSLLLVIPGIVKSFSYSMTYFILLEKPHYTVHQAIDESKRIMQGHKMDLFLLMLSFIGWFLLCAVTFGIAYFWVTPYVTVAMAHFYAKIKEEAAE